MEFRRKFYLFSYRDLHNPSLIPTVIPPSLNCTSQKEEKEDVITIVVADIMRTFAVPETLNPKPHLLEEQKSTCYPPAFDFLFQLSSSNPEPSNPYSSATQVKP